MRSQMRRRQKVTDRQLLASSSRKPHRRSTSRPEGRPSF
jgi:hypothetical protein